MTFGKTDQNNNDRSRYYKSTYLLYRARSCDKTYNKCYASKLSWFGVVGILGSRMAGGFADAAKVRDRYLQEAPYLRSIFAQPPNWKS